MPSPTTVADFVELVRKSGVIDEKRLDAHLEKLRAAAALPAEPGKLAGVLVRDGWISYTKFALAMAQTCVSHLLRRAHQMIEAGADDPAAPVPGGPVSNTPVGGSTP